MDVEPDWWRKHFSGLMADLWCSLLRPEETATTLAFVESACGGGLGSGSRILDVPCGEGRVARELARKGYQVTGVDISQDLLARAERQSAETGLSVEWRHGDMRELPWSSEFDLVCCLADSFGYLDDEGNAAFLAAARAAIKPGGVLAMEMKMVSEVLFAAYREEVATTVNGIALQVTRSYDPVAGRLNVEYLLQRGNNRSRRTASYRIYTAAQICSMLADSGFAETQLTGGTGAPFQIGADRLRVIARVS